jgi:AraC-like DNA-binding protein
MKSSLSSKEPVDPLSELLTLVTLRSARCTRLEASGAWALHFPKLTRLKFVAVLRGTCWIMLPDAPAHKLKAGDTFFLTNSRYTVASAPDVEPQDGMALFDAAETNIIRLGGNETAMLGGGFVFEGGNENLVINILPAFMFIPAEQPTSSVLRETLAMLDRELERSHMGTSLMTQRLADIMLIQALRAYVSEQGTRASGWIGALADRHIGEALTLMHGDVAHSWTVGELASAVAMSRSAFALRFKAMVGVAPLEYLRHWRMQLAENALRRNACSVAALAARLGYSSESAFGNAYKRTFGQSPKRHRFTQ